MRFLHDSTAELRALVTNVAFGNPRSEATLEEAAHEWKVGDKATFLGPGTPWHGEEVTVSALEKRKTGTIRYTVTTKQGRDIYCSAGSLRGSKG